MHFFAFDLNQKHIAHAQSAPVETKDYRGIHRLLSYMNKD
jgi:hypothetical protein